LLLWEVVPPFPFPRGSQSIATLFWLASTLWPWRSPTDLRVLKTSHCGIQGRDKEFICPLRLLVVQEVGEAEQTYRVVQGLGL
jgi:hypothetical protein